MFDLGFGIGEIVLIGALALIVVGPQDFPKMMHQIGRFLGKLRDIASEFKQNLDDAAHEQDIIELRKDIAEKLRLEQEQHQKQAEINVKK